MLAYIAKPGIVGMEQREKEALGFVFFGLVWCFSRKALNHTHSHLVCRLLPRSKHRWYKEWQWLATMTRWQSQFLQNGFLQPSYQETICWLPPWRNLKTWQRFVIINLLTLRYLNTAEVSYFVLAKHCSKVGNKLSSLVRTRSSTEVFTVLGL